MKRYDTNDRAVPDFSAEAERYAVCSDDTKPIPRDAPMRDVLRGRSPHRQFGDSVDPYSFYEVMCRARSRGLLQMRTPKYCCSYTHYYRLPQPGQG